MPTAKLAQENVEPLPAATAPQPDPVEPELGAASDGRDGARGVVGERAGNMRLRKCGRSRKLG